MVRDGRAGLLAGDADAGCLPFVIVGLLLVLGVDPRPGKPFSRRGARHALVLIVALLFVAVRLLMSSAVASAEEVGPVAIVQAQLGPDARAIAGACSGFSSLLLIAALVAVYRGQRDRRDPRQAGVRRDSSR